MCCNQTPEVLSSSRPKGAAPGQRYSSPSCIDLPKHAQSPSNSHVWAGIRRSSSPPFPTCGTQISIILGALWEEKAFCRSKSIHPHMNQIQSSFLRPSQVIYDLLFNTPPRQKHAIRANRGPIEVIGLWRRPLTPTITAFMWLPYIQRGALESSHPTVAKASDSHFNWALIHLSSVKGFRISMER